MAPQTGLNTRCVRAAHAPEAATGAIAEPIYLTTTFERDADGSYPHGYRYSREGSPNRTALESCVAALEGGVAGVAFASGLAANMALFELLRSGDHVVAPQAAYYGTLKQLQEYARERGISVTLADFSNSAAVKSALTTRTRLVWIETPANPLLSITDLEEVTAIGHAAGAQVVQEPTNVGAGLLVAKVSDADGNDIGLRQPPAGA